MLEFYIDGGFNSINETTKFYSCKLDNYRFLITEEIINFISNYSIDIFDKNLNTIIYSDSCIFNNLDETKYFCYILYNLFLNNKFIVDN